MKPSSLVSIFVCTILWSFLLLQSNLSADEVYLKNGDRITGNITSETEESISIETEAIGLVTINREFLDHIVMTDEIQEVVPELKPDSLWQRKLSIGYSKNSGNTESSRVNIGLDANKKTDNDETTFKGNINYSSTNKKMDSQKWYAMGRYAYSFGKEKRWYNFYRLEADHDRFANINYRIIPSIGTGYWLSDEPDWKVMAETGLGLEHTDYRDNTKDSNEVVLIPRAFFEKKLFAESRISQDLTLYPSLSDAGEFRLHSETKFTNPIDDKLSLSISLIDDYNANSPSGTKKNDMQIISALDYSF
ncbi:MAG: DUF481 domain-containing protein [Candidatus Omnitrophota bacterium]|jgi:putative salt-induced outer membrane protein YdiY